jgi:peptide/nickel transport system substrate-binding protein
VDDDEDPLTPRVSAEVSNVDDGTTLSLSYLSTNAPQRKQAGEIIVKSLSECGVEVYADYLDSAELFAKGPDGYIFGRQFDLVQLGTSASNLDANCLWYTSAQIPAESNGWEGINVSAYANLGFDAACSTLLNTLPDSSEHKQNYFNLQNIFSQELPSIPLYWRIKIGASRPDLCGLEINISALSDLWNIESFAFGDGCAPK